MNTNNTEAEQQLIKFRDQFYDLLSKYPAIKISGNQDGEPVAWIRTGEAYREYVQLHMPTSWKQVMHTGNCV